MIRYQAGDKELGGAEVQEGEAKEQGQAALEEEPQEAKAKKIKASGRGTTALAAVLPRHGTTARTTASTTASNRRIYGSSRGTSSVLPSLLPRATERFTVVSHGTTAPR